mgnify:CR=1 FL=1
MVLNYIWVASSSSHSSWPSANSFLWVMWRYSQNSSTPPSPLPKTAFEISLGLTGILALWLGVMKIGENSGMINASPVG